MKKNTNGFNLIELLIVMSLIGIILIGSVGINFNPQVNKQNSLLFLNNIFTTIEKVRNDSLLGRGVGNGILSHPDRWVISLGTPKTLNISYFSGATSTTYTDFHIDYLNDLASIEELKCITLDDSSSNTGSVIDIEITGNNLSLSGCTSTNQKILEIKTKYKDIENTIRLNTISGVIEKK